MHRSTRNQLAAYAVAGLAVVFAVAAPSAAFADTGAPPATATSTINTMLPTWGNPKAHDLNIYGAFKGARASDNFADYSVWVTCDDLKTYPVHVYKDTVTKYADGTVGGTLVASISALEEGHSCRIQTSAPAGRKLVFDSSGWVQPFAGYWELDLTGSVISVNKTGGLG
ncbi:hypothetical protein [Subtercola endophyticus]|uniref:hypothetical protein n=1 Tax=Subtercola endophyticus TaxID=2895559 RepID=UPI001E64EC69|nr:hypothetical protein [Subtercola endophyticus]UFS60735.1 hypothetical protein LQ955_08370 [Subtercola endophyticus]